jgi:translocation and assembly module TamB
VAVRGHAMRPASQALAFPVDVDLQAAYDGHKGSARLRAMRPEGVVLDARTNVDASLDALLDADPKARASWQASGSATLSNFPLASVAALGGSQVVGLASGTLRWDRINRDPDIQAQLDFKDLKLDRAVFPHAVVVLRIAKGGVVASANLEQVSGGGSATASARVQWTSPFVPDLDTREPLDVYFAAHDLRAAALYPLLFRGIFTYFDGRLNGTLHFHQEPAAKEVAQTFDGAFDLQEGVFQVPEVGQEFRNATAKITMTNRGEVEVTNVSANGTSGRMTAFGKMTMKGLSFVSGEGEVRIAKNEAVPLTLEGVSLGEAWGTLFLHAKMRDEHTVGLDVDLPIFHTDLPESSGRDIQALGDHPDVQVGVRTPSEAFSTVLLGPPQARRSDDTLRWRVTLFLGQDVGVRRGRNLELVLGGAPVIELTDEVRVSGQIEMRGGNVEVFGKRFDIEHGVARFEGDEPSNPYVSVIARWEGPDGTRIFANFVGPLRTGALTLRSEPARSQSEILAILLFGGSTDTVQQAKSNENGEWVVGGAAVTTGLNRVLSSVTPLDITTRVTSDSQSPTPEVAIQLSPKLTAEISYRTRTPTPLENQDRTLITLDWRFRRNWSIATTVGQQSTVLDLIWRYRY